MVFWTNYKNCPLATFVSVVGGFCGAFAIMLVVAMFSEGFEPWALVVIALLVGGFFGFRTWADSIAEKKYAKMRAQASQQAGTLNSAATTVQAVAAAPASVQAIPVQTVAAQAIPVAVQTVSAPAAPVAAPAAPAPEPAAAAKASPSPAPAAQVKTAISDDKIETLIRFKGLLDEGVISQEEFDNIKKDLLTGF